MSAMIVSASDIRPPAPTPCSARNAASSYIEVEIPQRKDPTTKTLIAKMKNGRRPYMSLNLP